VTDIVDEIDRATGCHFCEGSLEGSVSDLFCREECQQAWAARRVDAEPASPFEHFRQRYMLPMDPAEVFVAPAGTPAEDIDLNAWSRLGATIGPMTLGEPRVVLAALGVTRHRLDWWNFDQLQASMANWTPLGAVTEVRSERHFTRSTEQITVATSTGDVVLPIAVVEDLTEHEVGPELLEAVIQGQSLHVANLINAAAERVLAYINMRARRAINPRRAR
jgi:hypothetical protein